MKSIIAVLLLIFSLPCFCQIKTTIYNEKVENGFKILANNDEFCPASIKIDFELTNLSSSDGNHKIFVIPAKTKGFVITILHSVKANSATGFKIKSQSNYGDSNLKAPLDYTYSLPFEKGNSFAIYQGYNGSFSHQNENSLDFSMPVGTGIVAARDGIVVRVVENNNQSCEEKSCAAYNNYILLYHNDGTFSEYIHLKQNGVLVQEGDVVKENDLIAYSGNTGWSNGPHLHFMAFIQRLEKPETLKTKFKINDGKESIFLKEKVAYTRNY